MRNFKLNPESPLINLFKGNEDLLDYPVIVSTLAELSNEPLSFEGLHRLFFTRDDTSDSLSGQIISGCLFNKIIVNKTRKVAEELLPCIGEMLESHHRGNQSDESKSGLIDICSLWIENDVIDKAYEYSVEQSPDYTLLDALEREFNINERGYCNNTCKRYADLIRTSINKGIALEVLNNGAVYQATIGIGKSNEHTR